MPGFFSRREILAAAGGLAAAKFLRGQEEPVFSTDVRVVNVLATVRNKSGALVGDLTQDDFVLSEGDRPQTIRYFARESNLPLTLGLLVDTSGSQRRVLDAERGACLRFLDQVVREKKDQVFLMQFDTVIQVRQALTSSVGKLDDALAYVDSETMKQVRMRNGGGTLLYDALIRAADETMKKQSGRKALIVLSDGVDLGSGGSVQESMDAAQRADTLVYSILYSDSGAYGPFGGPDGKHVLQQLSKETGGSFFEVTKKQPVDKIFEILEEELRTQYSIGYSSDKPVTISEFRTIELNAKQKNLVVQARRQYWAQR